MGTIRHPLFPAGYHKGKEKDFCRVPIIHERIPLLHPPDVSDRWYVHANTVNLLVYYLEDPLSPHLGILLRTKIFLSLLLILVTQVNHNEIRPTSFHRALRMAQSKSHSQRQPKTYQSGPDPQSWENVKIHIQRLYLEENRPLSEVRQTLLNEQGFDAT